MYNLKNITTTNNLTNTNETLSIDYKKTDAFALTFTLSICFVFLIIILITCMADVFKKKCKCCNKKNYFQKIVRNESKYYFKEEDEIVDYSSLPPHIGGIINNNIKNKDKVVYANV